MHVIDDVFTTVSNYLFFFYFGSKMNKCYYNWKPNVYSLIAIGSQLEFKTHFYVEKSCLFVFNVTE